MFNNRGERFGFYLRDNLFSIMLFKKDEVRNPNPESSFFEDGNPLSESILITYKCEPIRDEAGEYRRICYISNEDNLKNHSLSEGDFINIRSETTIEKTTTKFSYNFTFLIELDPL